MGKTVNDIHLYGTLASRPAASNANKGCLYESTDESNKLYRSDGSTWTAYGPTPGAAVWGAITGTLADQTDLTSALAAKEATANKNAASGYPGLSAGSKILGSQITYGSAANTATEGNDSRLSDSRSPTVHATSHQSGGSDPIKLDDLATPDDNTDLNVSISRHGLTPKLPNESNKYLDGTGAFTIPPGKTDAAILVIIDGGGAAITTGVKADLEVPFGCTINRVTMLADQTGNLVVDIWKDTYASYPPTGADSITASAKPTLSAASKSQDLTLSGWTTSISAGDTLRFNVDSIATIQRVTVALKVTKT